MAPIFHRVHLVLTDFCINQDLSSYIDDQKDETVTNSVGNSFLSYLSSESLSMEKLVAAVSPTKKLSNTSSSSNTNDTNSTYNNKLLFKSPVKESPKKPNSRMSLSPMNGEEWGVALRNKSPLSVCEGERIISFAPSLIILAVSSITAFSNSSSYELDVLENALNIICSLRSITLKKIPIDNNIVPQMLDIEHKTLKALMNNIVSTLNIKQNECTDKHLVMLYKSLRAVRDLTMTFDTLAYTSLAEHKSVRALVYIFCGEPTTSSLTLTETERTSSEKDDSLEERNGPQTIEPLINQERPRTAAPRPQEWLPVMLQAADLLQVLILDKMAEVQLKLLVKACYGKKRFEPAPLIASDGNFVSSPVLQSAADSINFLLLPDQKMPFK